MISQPKSPGNNFYKSGWIYLVLSLAFILILGFTFDKRMGIFEDQPGYLITGQAISKGLGYTNIHLPGSPPANHFPPGYPFMLGLLISLTGFSISAVKLLNCILLAGTVFLVYRIFKQLDGKFQMAFWTSLFCLLNAHLVYYGFNEMSEVPFLFFSMFSLWTFLKYKQTLKLFWLLLLILLMTASIYIRSVGIAWLAAFVISFFAQKRILAGFTLALLTLLLLLPWQLRSQKLGGNQYTQQLLLKNPYRPFEGNLSISDLVERIQMNAQRYLAADLFRGISGSRADQYPPSFPWYSILPGLFILSIATYGFLTLKDDKVLFGVFFLFFGGILFCWPTVWFGTRFLVPCIPFLLYFVLLGFDRILQQLLVAGNKLIEVFYSKVPWQFVLIPFFAPGLFDLNDLKDRPFSMPFQNFIKMGKWTKVNVPDESVIATRKPDVFFLYSGKTCLPLSLQKDCNAFQETLDSGKAHFILADELGASTQMQIQKCLDEQYEKYEIVHYFEPKTILFKIHHECGYFGPMLNGQREGTGDAKHFMNLYYSGQWSKNKKNGTGKMVFPSGNIFEGHFKEDLFHGRGKMIYTQGGFLEGEWVMDSLVHIYSQSQN